ncbi:rhodopsin, GQ-coupled-like [Lineus longissimus]|uniref:rhodopsin, GQ-coupled-like n=1 Tax=Lineus longissimus TaxID=88925 RepID=UPI00315CDD7B
MMTTIGLFNLGTEVGSSSVSSFYLVGAIYNSIVGYIIPVILLIGIMGNTLSLVIFIRTRKRADAAVQYLSTLAISDTGFITTLGAAYWLKDGLAYVTDGAISFDLLTYSTATCKLIGFARHALEFASAWAIVAFTLERVYIVWYPLRRADITARKRTVIIIAIWVMSACLSIHRLVLNHIETNLSASSCYYNTPTAVTFIILIFDIIVFSYLPCLFILIANILILFGIRKAKAKMMSQVLTSKNEHQDGRLVISLLLVSTLYIVFMTPVNVCATHYFYYLKSTRILDASYREMLFYILTFLDQYSLLNYCSNFIIYGCTLPFYRKEVYSILSLGMRAVGYHGSDVSMQRGTRHA